MDGLPYLRRDASTTSKKICTQPQKSARTWDGTLFVGTHQRSLDEKGRIALPPSFRDDLGALCLVSRVQDAPALAIWTKEEFEQAVARLREKVAEGEATQHQVRRFSASATPLRLDSQGRITVPAPLREAVGIDREAAVIGAWSRIEIWNPEAWASVEDDDGSADEGAGSWL